MNAVVAMVVMGLGVMVAVMRTDAANIMIAVTVGTKSHGNFHMPIAEALARRNHTITYITGYKTTPRHPNIKVIQVPDVNIFDKMPNLFTANESFPINSVYEDMCTVCVKCLEYEEVQKLKEEKFDLVIMYSALLECFLSFVHTLKIPFIYIYPNKLIGGMVTAAGPAFPSISASYLLDLEYPLTFTGRMISTLHDLADIYLFEWNLVPRVDALCRERQLCPQDLPPLLELRLNASLTIINSVRTLESPVLPYTPTVVHAGGIHCRPAKPLPQDLQQWVAEAGENGFIYFSLGSFVKTSDMPEKYRRVFVEVFGSLQQRVLWKWNDEHMEDVPSNVLLSKWLPQQDILGHPQLRLFITHGGLFSIQEATYHGVPVLGIPVAIDQRHNMRIVKNEGLGHVLYWDDITYDNLRGHILQIINDQRIRKTIQKRSRLMQDQPMSPGDWATYWVEYVLKHQGATNLRSPAVTIPWYKLYNVDVWAVLLVTLLVITSLTLWIICKVIGALIRWCFVSKKKKRE